MVGASRFASRHFPKFVILTSCISVGRPFVAYYMCSFVYFSFSQYKVFDYYQGGGFLLAIRRLINEKLRFCRFRASLGVFWPYLPWFFKKTEYSQFIFSGTLFHSNIFCLGFFEHFLLGGSLGKNFQLNPFHQFLQYIFHLQKFHYLNFVNFWSYSTLKFSYRCNLQ